LPNAAGSKKETRKGERGALKQRAGESQGGQQHVGDLGGLTK